MKANSPMGQVDSACVVASIPSAVLFFMVHRYIVVGLTAGAMKKRRNSIQFT
jgi:ABC-type maltose transport system permease subunit